MKRICAASDSGEIDVCEDRRRGQLRLEDGVIGRVAMLPWPSYNYSNRPPEKLESSDRWPFSLGHAACMAKLRREVAEGHIAPQHPMYTSVLKHVDEGVEHRTLPTSARPLHHSDGCGGEGISGSCAIPRRRTSPAIGREAGVSVAQHCLDGEARWDGIGGEVFESPTRSR